MQSGEPLEKPPPCVLTLGIPKLLPLGFSLIRDDSGDPQHLPPEQLDLGWMDGWEDDWENLWMDGWMVDRWMVDG